MAGFNFTLDVFSHADAGLDYLWNVFPPAWFILSAINYIWYAWPPTLFYLMLLNYFWGEFSDSIKETIKLFGFVWLLMLLFPKQALYVSDCLMYCTNYVVHVVIHTIIPIVDYFISK